MTVHGCLRGNAPQYLGDCCNSMTDAVSRQLLRSASRHQPIVPRHRRSNFGRRAFTVAGPTAWNSLPDYLRDPSLSEDTFRQSLKTYLFALYYSTKRIRGVAYNALYPKLANQSQLFVFRSSPHCESM